MEHLPETRIVILPDGEQVAYIEYGEPDGCPVYYFHGTSGSRFEGSHGHAAGIKHGYKIIALDRPGIGSSAYVSGRTLIDWPGTVQQLAEMGSYERYGVIGVSGGGAYALACAYANPGHLDFTCILGSWAPVAREPGLWQAMAPLDRFFGKLSCSVPWVFYIPFSSLGYAARWLSPERFMKTINSSMSEADKKLASDGEFASVFASDIIEAFRQGVRGPADDAILLYRDWGFDFAGIDTLVDIFHGMDDQYAPYEFAEYLHQRIPDSVLHPYPGKGHLFLIDLFEDVFQVIKTRSSRQS